MHAEGGAARRKYVDLHLHSKFSDGECSVQCLLEIAQKKGLKAVLINIYGGINPIHEGARGIVRYIEDNNLTIPIIAKALGNRQEETWEILRSGGVHVVTDVATEKAVERLFELVGG